MWSFLKNHHYVWETGLSGHLSYAPLGKKIKNNLENFIRREFQFHDFEEVETPLIFRKDVWIQSGHWDRFQDPIIKSKKGKSYRVDKLIEEYYPDVDYSALSEEKIKELLVEISDKLNSKAKNPEMLDPLVIEEKIQYQSLMMKTTSGHEESGLRPETATATYFHFKELSEFNGHKWPIKVFQIGRSFRNEINPKHNLIRGREFTQAEFQVILPSAQKEESLQFAYDEIEINLFKDGELIKIKGGDLTAFNFYKSLICLTYQVFLNLGIPFQNLRIRQHGPDEMAFYALDAYDLEINLKNIGWTEIAGIHDRGSYDLRAMGEDAPHILEVAIGIDRLVYSILDTLYEEKDVSDGKSMLKLPYYLAPIQVSVLPLMKNKEIITSKAKEIYFMLKRRFVCEYADKKSIGKRYLANAQRGIPYSITVDFETITENDPLFGTVTVRDRDTENQIRVNINDLANHLFQSLYV